jgi:hypothetical protein
MLTAKDLALIRAALLFFQEENCTGNRSAMKHYFGSDSCRGVTAKTVQELRQRLETCQLRFTVFDQNKSRTVTEKLYRSATRANCAIYYHSHSVAAVLLSPRILKPVKQF